MGLFEKLFGSVKKNLSIEPPKNISFTPSDQLMADDQFWQIIKTTKEFLYDLIIKTTTEFL